MPHETRGTRSTPATLDAIDATVDGRCACGCGQLLLADGPSAWFVDADHQAAWAMRGTANPAQVLLGPDAADVFPDHDARPVPLSEAGDRLLGFCCDAGAIAAPSPCPWHADMAEAARELGRVFVARQAEWGRAWQQVTAFVEQTASEMSRFLDRAFLNGDTGRGIVTQPPITAEPAGQVDIYEQLVRLQRQLSAAPAAARVREARCGRSIVDSLRTMATPSSPTTRDPLGYLLGIPIVPDASLPDDGWRLLDARGNVVAEGRGCG